MIILNKNTVYKWMELLAPFLAILEARWRVTWDEEERTHGMHVTQRWLWLGHLQRRDSWDKTHSWLANSRLCIVMKSHIEYCIWFQGTSGGKWDCLVISLSHWMMRQSGRIHLKYGSLAWPQLSHLSSKGHYGCHRLPRGSHHRLWLLGPSSKACQWKCFGGLSFGPAVHSHQSQLWS